MQSIPKSLNCILLVKDKSIQVQCDNIEAVNTISNILTTCLGPRSMQKMILTRIGTIQITNDGNAILRELDITHPAAKQIVELARTQDNEVGDGTTTVILLAAKLLEEMGMLLRDKVHPVHICKILREALNESLSYLEEVSYPFQGTEDEKIGIVRHSVANKLCTMLKVDIAFLAYKAANIAKNCDIKTFVKIEKISGADFSGCEVMDGVIVNKSLIHSEMRREIRDPRVIVLDTPIEYKKGESKTSYELKNQAEYTRALEIEEEQVQEIVNHILALNPDIVITEKGICDSALSIFQKKNVTALRRFKKTEALRIAAVTGATIVSRAEDLEEKHVGKDCRLFRVTRFGNEEYVNFVECVNPKACSVVLRGPSRDILNEFERNFEDAIKVARNLRMSDRLCAGGGATEMNLCKFLLRKGACTENMQNSMLRKRVYDGIANALRMIPLTLAKNSGCDDPLGLIAELESTSDVYMGIDGVNGKVVDVRNLVMEPIAVKRQALKSAFEAVALLLRVDGVIQSKKK
ncbi:T-complex protein 1, gamma subunit [Vavraia culicis subsp. floridensis]|uniref:T-complex protein 1, gamma subunit n=1 Tax=Vavraia culicis (isolate floridensis) TaxID=948595 RepID=L2GWT8_VAVCU|nr:T-complex protein 1, gamma subunit [Vavraia culicis subsp. floridensis]ELA48141.1 T-complex protein 1, gamma subunit [Vavraia culicis subsp. floridensis]